MTPNEYQVLAARTECNQTISARRMYGVDVVTDKDGNQGVVQDLTAVRVNHSLIGIAGELGELASLLQKQVYYGKEYDPEKLKLLFAEEYGDVLWYIAEGLNALGLSFQEIMEANIRKLIVRYPDKYTDQHADIRDLEKEAEALKQHAVKWTPGMDKALDVMLADKKAEDPKENVSSVIKRALDEPK